MRQIIVFLVGLGLTATTGCAWTQTATPQQRALMAQALLSSSSILSQATQQARFSRQRAIDNIKRRNRESAQQWQQGYQSMPLIPPTSAPIRRAQSGWGDGWERSSQPPSSGWDDPRLTAPTAREPVNPYDFLPRGHEENVRRQYENQQYRSRYGGCANMYDNNPAAKEMCLKGLGR